MKKCYKCKLIKPLNEFNTDPWRKDNLEGQCKTCKKERDRLRYLKNPKLFKDKQKRYAEKYPEKIILRNTKNGAKTRGHSFELTLEQFNKIINQSCHYCGKKGLNGIDRKDNTQGYILDNCLPCCYNCNVSKNDRTYLEYIEWIKQSYKHLTHY